MDFVACSWWVESEVQNWGQRRRARKERWWRRRWMIILNIFGGPGEKEREGEECGG